MVDEHHDDDQLGITRARDLGIVRRYSCGCAVVRPYGDEREMDQPALTCDLGEGHARTLVVGHETQGRLW